MKARWILGIAVACIAVLGVILWLVADDDARNHEGVASEDPASDERGENDEDEKETLAAAAGVGRRERSSSPDGGVAPIAERPLPPTLPHVESRQERSMTFAEKARQTERMVVLLTGRADRVAQRVADARSRGDAAELARQEVILQRLRQRTEALRVRARELAEEARTEDPSQVEPYDEPESRVRVPPGERHP